MFRKIQDFFDKKSKYNDLIVLGSSSTELFDYIFGDNPQYYPFWADGWCIRTTYKKQEIYYPYIDTLLQFIDRNAIIFMNFGNADIDFILRFKMSDPNFSSSSLEAFSKQLAHATKDLYNYLINIGFKSHNIYSIFANPPILLSNDYWLNLDNYLPVNALTRSNMYQRLIADVASFMQVIDVTDKLIDKQSGLHILDKAFMRQDYEDHHQDYTKTQQLVWDTIHQLNIDKLIQPRQPFHNHLYPHTHEQIEDLLALNRARVKTCH